MKYTKEQAEMLALLVLMGCAVIVLTFLYLVKPNFAKAAQSKQELTKIEAEIATLHKATLELAKAKKEMETLTGKVERGEGAIFSGLETNPPLTQVCVQAATKLNLKPAFGAQITSPLLEFSDKGTDGSRVTRHYDEVLRTLDIQSADFFSLCRFLAGVENANEALRVTHLEFENLTLDPKDQEKGNVKAKIELSMLGIREAGGELPKIDVSGSEQFDVAQKRNPFGPAGGRLVAIQDPLKNIKDTLSGIRATAIWSDTLMMAVPGTGSITVMKGETFVVGQMKMEYVSVSADSLVFEAVDYGKRYKLIINSKGQVKSVTEEEVK